MQQREKEIWMINRRTSALKKRFQLAFSLVLCLLFCTNAMAQEQQQEQQQQEPQQTQQECKGLQKVNNLDEMLYQFYINLDSDCLFEMPLLELEAIWGIKIDFYQRFETREQMIYERRSGPDFYAKPYRSEADAFVIKATLSKNKTTRFRLVMTQEYNQAHATLFPEGNFPKLLPEPLILYGVEWSHYPSLPYNRPRPKNTGQYNSHASYDWVSADRKRKISITPDQDNGVSDIYLFKFNKPIPQMKNIEK